MEFEKLQEIIADVLQTDKRLIKNDTDFLNDLGADSLDLFEIVMGIEDEFQISINPQDASKIRTVGEAFSLIQKSGEKRD